MWVGVGLAAAVGAWLWRTPAPASGGWSWRAAGLALGGIGIAVWLTSAASGRPYGLSMTGPLRTWFEWGLAGEIRLDWGYVLIVGLIAGSFAAAWLHRELRWRVPPGARLLQSGAGGVVMGLGAQLAGGCNIGHSLAGLSVAVPGKRGHDRCHPCRRLDHGADDVRPPPARGGGGGGVAGMADATHDVRGEICPYPLYETKKAVEAAAPGATV